MTHPNGNPSSPREAVRPAQLADVREVREEVDRRGPIPVLCVAHWTRSFPWLVHGVTVRRLPKEDGVPREDAEEALDFRLWGPGASGPALERWEALRKATDADAVVHARQIHGAGVRVHHVGGAGLHLTPACDGHLTADENVLLTVSLADCLPVFLVAPEPRAIGLLHAGWRGIASGIVEAGIDAFLDRFGVEPDGLHVHLGPAISEEAYEVSPEVFRALGLPDPGCAANLDLRTVVATRIVRQGVNARRISISTRCTRRDSLLFSHRGGDTGRHLAFLGVRDRAGAFR